MQKEPNVGFYEKERSFLDALKDPTKSQRAFITNFGLALASSDSTNSLSQRIAGALGVGSKAMTDVREKQLTREQALARLDLENYKTRRANLQETVNLGQKQFDLNIKEAQEQRAKDSSIRQKQEFERKQSQDFLQPGDIAYNDTIDNARAAVDLFGSQMVEYTDKNGEVKQISVLDPEYINIYKQARVAAEQNNTDEQDEQVILFNTRLGVPTRPNEMYNPQFLDQLNNSMKVKRSGTGKKDNDAEFYSKLGSGAFGGETTKKIKDRYKKSQNFKDGVKAAIQEWKKQNPGKPLLPRTYYEDIVLNAAFRL